MFGGRGPDLAGQRRAGAATEAIEFRFEPPHRAAQVDDDRVPLVVNAPVGRSRDVVAAKGDRQPRPLTMIFLQHNGRLAIADVSNRRTSHAKRIIKPSAPENLKVPRRS